MKLAVLASGRGSNLARLVAACESGDLDAQVAVVVCNVPGAGAITVAQDAGIPVAVLDHREFATRADHERAIAAVLRAHAIDLVVLAGYMRLISPFLIGHLHDPELGHARIVNIHPADTARYQGPDGYGWAIRTTQPDTAVTVHVVDEGMDTGPVILQETVPILPGDTLETLRARGLAVEHRLYPRAVQAVLERIRKEQPCAAF